MATRLTKGGLQSFDPEAELRKKFKGAGTGTTTPPPIPPPTPPPKFDIEAQLPPDVLANRFANANVAPYQPGMTAPLSQGVTTAFANKDILQKQLTQEALTRQVQGELANPPANMTMEEMTREVPKGELTREASFLPGVSTALGLPPQRPPIDVIRNIGGQVISGAAEIIDGFASVLLSKKSAQVSTAESSLADARAAIINDIALVRAGLKDFNEAKLDFLAYTDALERLERTTHGIGKLNLRYWLGGGKDVEAEVLRAKRIIPDFYIQLQDASNEARLNKAKERLALGF